MMAAEHALDAHRPSLKGANLDVKTHDDIYRTRRPIGCRWAFLVWAKVIHPSAVKAQLVGTWDDILDGESLEFRPDGTAAMIVKEMPVPGSYIVDSDRSGDCRERQSDPLQTRGRSAHP